MHFTSLRASHFVFLTETGKMSNCSMFNVPFFILLAICYFMAQIQRKYIGKTGSHNDSLIYSAMLKRVEWKKCTIPIRQHYEAVPNIHIDAPIWIFGIAMRLANMDSVQWKILTSANGNFTALNVEGM